MKAKSKCICVIVAVLICSPSLASAGWYVSKVVEVSTRSDTGTLYIRTESNPNPNSCASAWNGAQWGEGDGVGQNLAASIALAAKATGSDVKFFIKEGVCGLPSGNPVIEWIQHQ